MSDDNGPEMSRPTQVMIAILVVVVLMLTFAASVALLRWLPFALKPLALVPIMLFARYGAGNTWVESGCLVGMIGGLIAVSLVVIKLARMLPPL